jgi:hypothetical protein
VAAENNNNNNESHDLYSSSNVIREINIKKCEVGGSCRTHG